MGKEIAQACIENYVPYDLVLSGKSPVIVQESASVELAAESIVHGKLLNFG